jgi:hypothetical protein
MTDRKCTLELTRIGKEHRPKIEPSVLLEHPAWSYYTKCRVASANFLVFSHGAFGKPLSGSVAMSFENRSGDQFADAGKLIRT